MDIVPWLRATWSLQHPGPHSRDMLRAYRIDQPFKVLPHCPSLSIQRSGTPFPTLRTPGSPKWTIVIKSEVRAPCLSSARNGDSKTCLSQPAACRALFAQQSQASGSPGIYLRALPTLSFPRGVKRGRISRRESPALARACYTVASSDLTQEVLKSEAFL